MDIELFNTIMSDIFDTKINRTDNEYFYYETLGINKNGQGANFETRLSKVEFKSIQDKLKTYKYENNQIFNTNEYESLIKYESFNPLIGKMNKSCNGSKDVSEYLIGNASIYLTLNTLMDAHSTSGESLKNLFFKSYKHYANFLNENADNISVIHFLKYLTSEFHSVKVKFNSNQPLSLKRWYADLYLFQLAFDYDFSISLADKNLNYLFRSVRHFGAFRKNIHEPNLPKKQYETTIIKLYKRALSTNTIEYQFLSFYQILEYLYDRVLIEKGVDEMKFLIEQDMLADKDLYHLMHNINEDYKNSREEELLKNVLLKYLGDEEEFSLDIKKELDRFGYNMTEYFKNNKVSFSKGNEFDLDQHDLNEIAKKLSNRIYSVRNSIVHRKSKKDKFDPVLNSKEMVRETILIRVISEIVINNYSYDL